MTLLFVFLIHMVSEMIIEIYILNISISLVITSCGMYGVRGFLKNVEPPLYMFYTWSKVFSKVHEKYSS